ncbi:MAG: glycoside hydrolase family 36 protein [Saprospiraceae bacterium]
MDTDQLTVKIPGLQVVSESADFRTTIEQIEDSGDLQVYRLSLSCDEPTEPSAVTVKWQLPSFNMQGVWKAGKIHDKRQQYDWELEHLESRVSVDAPVITVFGHDDANAITFACSDAVNMVEMNALLREEDNQLYCHLTFFKERHPAITNYTAEIRVDTRSIPYYRALQGVTKWWESFENTKPSPVPPLAKVPLYSTWYNFHQNLDEAILLAECEIAVKMGYELIILDDGWQTMDTNRGYDYTGDWQPDRFPNMPEFVEKIHTMGMKFGLWFSVPFCGKHSKAYQRFKGKFLTENHRWAPVFDPRYPEVREYLINIYINALKDYKLDAFKLDFIDDFKVYPETVLTKENGRDYANVNEAVDRLMTDVMNSLRAIKPDIGIEFRQQYIGPVMRKFGNMFRAFDCPNDAVSNRIRITDVKLLCGETAVHSDPQTWHPEEKVEIAALQVLNGMFGVPQMSVELRDLPAEHLKMIDFYTKYWRENVEVLMDGDFQPTRPLANYPLINIEKDEHAIIGLYDDLVVDLPVATKRVDILNGKLSDTIIIRNSQENEALKISVYDCQGNIVNVQARHSATLFEIEVPACGMIRISK